MYLPDAIAYYRTRGKDYLVTASGRVPLPSAFPCLPRSGFGYQFTT